MSAKKLTRQQAAVALNFYAIMWGSPPNKKPSDASGRLLGLEKHNQSKNTTKTRVAK